MKKSIKQAVSKGLALLVLIPAAHTAFAGVAGGVEYRVAWNTTDSSYHVFARPTTTPDKDLSMTGQVTLRVPHATGADKFTVANLKVKSGTSWSLNSEVFAPSEDTSVDYLSFSYSPIDIRAFAFQAGVEQEIFSFKNTSKCLGSVALMNNNTDPFNQPPEATNNSAGTNPGNQFANAGWGTTVDNDYIGNYGEPADCAATGTNTAPIANPDTATTTGSPATISVLANDSDADGDTLSISSFTQGSKGGVVTQSGTSLIYTPAAGFTGTDTFTYEAIDTAGNKATGTVTVTVNAATSNAPDAMDDTAETTSGTPVSVAVLSNDTDPDGDTLSIASFTQGSNGTITQSGTSLVYTPAADFSGTDTFTYVVSDPAGNQSTGTVSVTVNAVTPVLVAKTDSFIVDTSNAASSLDVLANDTIPASATITLTIVTDPLHGTATIKNNKIIYVPNSEYSGTDTLTYRVTDGDGNQTEADVTLTVKATITDTDGDGLTDAQEATLGTNPTLADSDTDGISDKDEIGADLSKGRDTDGDGKIDALDTDDDGDGILTTDEKDDVNNNGTPDYLETGSTVPKDTDGDGLTDAQEATLGTNPTLADSDGDGISDKDEIGTNLSKGRDTDDDGKIDALDTDDDGDGILTASERTDANGNGILDYLEKPTSTAAKSVAVPTLTQWAQMLLSLLLGAVALRKYMRLGK